MRSIASAMRDLDTALARAVQLEFDAKHWRIRSGQWLQKYEKSAAEVADLTAQLKFAHDTMAELVKMVDTTRVEAR